MGAAAGERRCDRGVGLPSNHRVLRWGDRTGSGHKARSAAPAWECPFASHLLGKSFIARAAEAAARSRAHPTLGGGRPTPGEVWEMGEVVRLVSGAGLGIHAGWQALVGED